MKLRHVVVPTMVWLSLVLPANATTLLYTNEAAFLANTTPSRIESFESLPHEPDCSIGGASPSVSIATSGFSVSTTPTAGGTSFLCIGTAAGGPHATDGINALIAGSNSDDPWQLTFLLDTPSNAVGFYLTDAAESGHALITTSAGDSFIIASCCLADDSELFFGLINPSASFSSFTLINTGFNDGWGVDKIMLTGVHVPAPGTFTLLGLGLAGLGLSSLRKTRH